MAKMSRAQRNTIIEAHTYRTEHPNGLRDAHVEPRSYRTTAVLRMELWIDMAHRVTAAGLRAAGVDMDAIHATALYENALREIDDAAQEQATSRYLHFAAAVLEGKSYRAALDILHSEALSEDYWRTYPVTATEAAKASPRMLGFSRQAMIANGDMDRAHAEARAEYREVTRAAREADSAAYQRSLVRDLKGDGGWGQSDGMLGTIEADQPTANPYSPVASPRAYDLWEADRLLRADLTAARADGVALPIVPAPREAALRAAAELRSMINGETISDNVLRRALREQLSRLDTALSAILS